MFFNESKITHS